VPPSRFASAYGEASKNIECFGEIFEAPIAAPIHLNYRRLFSSNRVNRRCFRAFPQPTS
jgi:hypothetical protein